MNTGETANQQTSKKRHHILPADHKHDQSKSKHDQLKKKKLKKGLKTSSEKVTKPKQRKALFKWVCFNFIQFCLLRQQILTWTLFRHGFGSMDRLLLWVFCYQVCQDWKSWFHVLSRFWPFLFTVLSVAWLNVTPEGKQYVWNAASLERGKNENPPNFRCQSVLTFKIF